MENQIIGKINSLQSFGTVDGPGIRFVVFMAGCSLRCKCCHNPDTWVMANGTDYTPAQVLEKIIHCREYFGEQGGVTISGGEPLLQTEFCTKLFELCKENGINTCLDTSGCVISDKVINLLKLTDRVLLDIKYTTEDAYLDNVGCSLTSVLEFLKVLDDMQVPTTIRQVIIPTVNDTEVNIHRLNDIVSRHACVDNIELLPFRKFCSVKYDNLGIEFPFWNKEEPTKELMDKLNGLLVIK